MGKRFEKIGNCVIINPAGGRAGQQPALSCPMQMPGSHCNSGSLHAIYQEFFRKGDLNGTKIKKAGILL